MFSSYKKKIYIDCDDIIDDENNLKRKHKYDYRNTFDHQILNSLCNHLYNEDEDDDQQFAYWFMLKIIPYNVLVLSINILFLIIVVIFSSVNLKNNGFVVLELIEWIVLSLMSIGTFSWIYFVANDDSKLFSPKVSKSHIIYVWNQMSIAIIFLRIFIISYKIANGDPDAKVFSVDNDSHSIKFITNNKADGTYTIVVYTSVLVQIAQLSFWMMCFSNKYFFALFTTLEQLWIYLKIESYNNAFFSKPFFIKWLASSSLGYLLIFYVITINTPGAFISSARKSWNLARDQKRIVKEKESWIVTLSNELKLSLQLIISPMKHLEKIQDTLGRQSIVRILQHTIVVNAAVDNLLLVSDMREESNKKYNIEDIIDMQRIFSSISKCMPIIYMTDCISNDDIYVDQFIDYKYPKAMNIRMNEVLFTALMKNMILSTLEYLQKIVQNKRNIMKIVDFQIDLVRSTATDAVLNCIIAFNINLQRSQLKCIQLDSIYVETIKTICSSINGKCYVTDMSVNVIVPCKVDRVEDDFPQYFSRPIMSRRLSEQRVNSKRPALVLYDNVELLEALGSALESFMEMEYVEIVNYQQLELDKINSLLILYDLIFVSSVTLGEKLAAFYKGKLLILFIGAASDPASYNNKDYYDYILTLPCLSSDTMRLINFISTFFFKIQQRNRVISIARLHNEDELKEVEDDTIESNSLIRSKFKYTIKSINAYRRIPSAYLKKLKNWWEKTKNDSNKSQVPKKERGKSFFENYYDYLPKPNLFMNVFNYKIEEEYTEYRLIMNKPYINYWVVFIIVVPILANIRLMFNTSDTEPHVQKEQKKYLQKPIYVSMLVLLCIAIARRRFFHINRYFSIYRYWKWISIFLTFGNILVTLSMMINCKKGQCHYQYPSPEMLEASDNIFLEIFGVWPGIGLIVVTMARTIFSRVIWSFYLPWPWPIYLMMSSLFRQIVVINAFSSLFNATFFNILWNVLLSSDAFSIALIYATEFLHRNEFQQYKIHLRSTEFIEEHIPIYLAALQSSFSIIIDSSVTFIDCTKKQICKQDLQLTEDISNSFGNYNIGFVKLQEIRDIILLKNFSDSKASQVLNNDDDFWQWLKNAIYESFAKYRNKGVVDTINLSDTLYLVNETQRLVSVFNANFHEQIEVFMSIEPELTIIFSNKLFSMSAISNFLYNSFQNVKRKVRYNRNDIQEILIFIRIENTVQGESFTSTKQIRVDFIDTGNAEKSNAEFFPSMIWNQVSQLFGNSRPCSYFEINHLMYKNVSTLYLPYRMHPVMVRVKQDFLRTDIFRISKSRDEILRLRASYNMNDHLLKKRLTDCSKIDGKYKVLIISLEEIEDITLSHTSKEFYTQQWNTVDMTEFKTLDYSSAITYDCILLNFPSKSILKTYRPDLNTFFNTLKVLRYYMIVAALVDENDDEILKDCDHIILKPLIKYHTFEIAEKIRVRKIEQILSI